MMAAEWSAQRQAATRQLWMQRHTFAVARDPFAHRVIVFFVDGSVAQEWRDEELDDVARSHISVQTLTEIFFKAYLSREEIRTTSWWRCWDKSDRIRRQQEYIAALLHGRGMMDVVLAKLKENPLEQELVHAVG